MPWYAGHIILYTKFSDGIQDTYPVWENILMINAPTAEEAFDRAERKGRFEASVSNGYTYGGRPVTWVFAGVRKLNECIEDFEPEQRATGGMEEDGTEVTYSSFILDSETALQQLVADKSVSLIYEGNKDDVESSSEPA